MPSNSPSQSPFRSPPSSGSAAGSRRTSDGVALGTVEAYNEWDPLEEVIVGRVEGATVPPYDVALASCLSAEQREFFRTNAGKPFPAERVTAAHAELEELCHILEGEGVTVQRPDLVDFARPYATPHWTSQGGFYAAMPRDFLLVIGDEIIESPMAWRSRYYEASLYRRLIKQYFRNGARWTAAPRPELRDELYDHDYIEPVDPRAMRYPINELEPTFDAADFIRCGRDIFGQPSNVTNQFGIQWLQRHLGDDYRIHTVTFDDLHPLHIDGTFIPMAPGKVLVCPDRVKQVPAMFAKWDVLEAPRPVIPDSHPLYMTSKWVSMNTLMLDEQRVVVERQEEPLIRAMKEWGFTPILCNFRNFNSFGGSFHCATADIRRRGTLQSYF